jgi:hypothetical protein
MRAMGFYLRAIVAALVVGHAPSPSRTQVLGDPPTYQRAYAQPAPTTGPGTTAGRVWAEIGLGFALDLIPAAITFGGLLAHCDNSSGDLCAIMGVAIFGPIGATVGAFLVPLGVLLGGHALGGSGGYGWALLGGIAGAAIGWSLVMAAALTEVAPLIIGAGALVPLLHIGGAILGYELSSDDNQPPASVSFAPGPHGFDARITLPF